MQVAPSNVIGNPLVFVSSNQADVDKVHLLRRDDGGPTPAWTPDDADSDKFVQVEFDDLVTITSIIVQGGLNKDGDEAYVTSFRLEYKHNDDWRKVPQVLTGNDDATSQRLVLIQEPINTKVSDVMFDVKVKV